MRPSSRSGRRWSLRKVLNMAPFWTQWRHLCSTSWQMCPQPIQILFRPRSGGWPLRSSAGELGHDDSHCISEGRVARLENQPPLYNLGWPTTISTLHVWPIAKLQTPASGILMCQHARISWDYFATTWVIVVVIMTLMLDQTHGHKTGPDCYVVSKSFLWLSDRWWGPWSHVSLSVSLACYRIPGVEVLKPRIPDIPDSIANAMVIDNEENSLLCMKFHHDLHRCIRSANPNATAQDVKVAKYCDFVKQVDSHFSTARFCVYGL